MWASSLMSRTLSILNKITKGRFTEETKTDMDAVNESEILSEIGAEKVNIEQSVKAEMIE